MRGGFRRWICHKLDQVTLFKEIVKCSSTSNLKCVCNAVSDITHGKFKITALVLFDAFWSIGIIILSFITEYESRWTQLYFVISYPTLIIIYLTR